MASTALQQVLDTAHFVVRLIFGTGDQQLVTTLARPAFRVVGDAGIAGIFQIRDHRADRTGTPGAQPRRDGIRVIVMLLTTAITFSTVLSLTRYCFALPLMT